MAPVDQCMYNCKKSRLAELESLFAEKKPTVENRTIDSCLLCRSRYTESWTECVGVLYSRDRCRHYTFMKTRYFRFCLHGCLHFEGQ